MFFYNFDMLDNFITSTLSSNLKMEINHIEQILDLYNNKKTNLLSMTTNIIESGDSIEKGKLECFYETVSSLKNCFEEANHIQLLASELRKNLTEIFSLFNKNFENNKEEIKANLVEYNKQKDELLNNILKFESTNTPTIEMAVELLASVSNKKSKKQLNNNLSPLQMNLDIELEPHDNDTLIISEKDQKAYLPFFYSQVKEIYHNKKLSYLTMQDVVNNIYIVPLDKFNNSPIARFRESFRLVREKEKGTFSKALELGLELMFRYEVNPIIIAACRNLDELDIYLDCLEENELEHFPCFKIKFEIMPQVKKLTKKNTFLF